METIRRLSTFPGLLLVVALAFFAVVAVAEEGDDDIADATQQGVDAAESVESQIADTVESPEKRLTPEEVEAGQEAFLDIAEVLKSPRCMNCHPAGNKPLQTDESRPHALAVSHESTEVGLECATCHREQNSEAWGVEGGPPGAPHWGLPPRDMPMVFEGRTPQQLCEQLKDPTMSGHEDLGEFLHHVKHDKLVHWGWEPGGDRTTPPLSYEEFVEASRIWVESGGVCPE